MSLSQSCFINRGLALSHGGVFRLRTVNEAQRPSHHSFAFLPSLSVLTAASPLQCGRAAAERLSFLRSSSPLLFLKVWGHLKPWGNLQGDSDYGRLCSRRVSLAVLLHVPRGRALSSLPQRPTYTEDKLAAASFVFKVFFFFHNVWKVWFFIFSLW